MREHYIRWGRGGAVIAPPLKEVSLIINLVLIEVDGGIETEMIPVFTIL